MNDAQLQHLHDRVSGLQRVVTALMTHLIQKDVTNEEGLLLALDGFAITADLSGEQLEAFESVKRSLLAEGVWIPQLVQGGKQSGPGHEDDPESE